MAYSVKNWEKTPVRIWCICGDGEMMEGSCWEAIAIASYYGLDNLTIIIDLNRLGQSRPAMHEHKANEMKAKVLRLPEKGDIQQQIQEQLIVELYSK